MKGLTSTLFILFINLTFLLPSSNIFASSGDKEIDEYWQDVGYSFDYVIENHINSEKCLVNKETTIACINGINGMINSVFEKVHVIVPAEQYSNYVNFIEEVKDLGMGYKIGKLKLTSKEDDVVEYVREVNKRKLEVLEIWKRHIDQNDLWSIQIDWILGKLKTEYLTEENQLNVALAGINNYIVHMYYDHSFIIPKDFFIDQSKKSNEIFYGIGAVLSKVNNKLFILKTMVEGGAKKAGIRGGDEILAVDGISVSNEKFQTTVNRIKGPEGTTVRLLISRMGAKFEIEIIRMKVVVKNVESSVLNHNNEKYGYIKLRSFVQDTACSNVEKAIRKLEEKRVKGLILDLRDNGGGLTTSAACIGGLFLGKDEDFSEMKVIGWRFLTQIILTTSEKATSLPLVVLINHASASASEMLTGALLYHNRALTVGARTFGKGSAQTITDADDNFGKNLDLRNGSSGLYFAVTVKRFYGPDGRNSNQLVGVSPHFDVPARGTEVKEIREEDVAFNPVPSDGKIVTPMVPKSVEQCVERTGNAEASFKRIDVDHSYDFQLLFAKDVVSCMP